MSEDILIGFEFEIDTPSYRTYPLDIYEEMDFFTKQLKSLGYKPSKVLQDVVYDHTVENGVELITHPLEFNKAFELAKDICYILETENKYRTSRKTGFHVNVSWKSKVKRRKVDVIKVLREYKPTQLLKDFSRSNHGYCLPYYLIDVEDFLSELPIKFTGIEVTDFLYPEDWGIGNGQALKCLDIFKKSVCLTLKGFDGKSLDKSYFELRGFGGANYHQKLDKVKSHTEQFINLMKQHTNKKDFEL